MSVKKILVWPNPILSQKSEPADSFDSKETKQIIRDLLDTAAYADENISGTAGLAAPQIGYLKKIMLVQIDKKHYGFGTNGPMILINPDITLREGSFTWDEACLSIPDEYGPVTRYDHIEIKFTNIDGKPEELELFNEAAGVFQHEYDHLVGKLWIDYQGKLKQNMVRKRMKKLKSILDPDHAPYIL